MQRCKLLNEETEALVQWAKQTRADAETPFAAAQQLVRRLGAHYQQGAAEIGFWVPELNEQEIPPEQIYLEILTPRAALDFQADVQEVEFARQLLQLAPDGEYLWGVIEGMQPGTREQVGSFYSIVYRDLSDNWQRILDPLAYSVPFGAASPAELYDMAKLQAERTDQNYFKSFEIERVGDDGVPRLVGPTNILQIHINTASAEGTLAGLTKIYRAIAEKQRNEEALSVAERNYVGYDAVQLMPIEPTIEYQAGPAFWQPLDDDPTTETVTIKLLPPDMTNWGYDSLTVGSPAVNAPVLGSKRPDEFVDFVATLHNFPTKPLKVVLDVVYGHADNQALPLLNHYYFAGANMYGQNFNYLHPVVRAVLLEMQRRKSDYGVDGVRVDGAQDFKWWDPQTDTLHHDDEYLALMNDVVQEVAGQKYRPWMIFEDGRPWPRDDWELASSYREVTKQHPNVVQWGPLTFAHNTPFLFTFWASKYWRVREIMEVGSHWITGCANHDTLRRGTQVNPESRVNTYLGNTLPQIFKKAYDNATVTMFTYAFSPGVPMDFINATMRAPWSFIRNVDDLYGVKVVSEEAYFLDWGVAPHYFQADDAFVRLKGLGFDKLDELRRFLRSLDNAVKMTDYNLAAMAQLLNNVEPVLAGPAEFTIQNLKQIARAWMDDIHDYCNVSRWSHELKDRQTAFNLAVRNFRRARPWLRNNLGPDDYFDYLHPTSGSVIFYGLRHAPDKAEQVLFVANMEGAPRTVTPLDLPIPNLPLDNWQLKLTSPILEVLPSTATEGITLHDRQGVTFVRYR